MTRAKRRFPTWMTAVRRVRRPADWAATDEATDRLVEIANGYGPGSVP